MHRSAVNQAIADTEEFGMNYLYSPSSFEGEAGTCEITTCIHGNDAEVAVLCQLYSTKM